MTLTQSAADAFIARFDRTRGALDPMKVPAWMESLRATAERFTSDHVVPRLAELDRDLPDGRPDPALIRAAARAGILTMTIPRLLGGDSGVTTFFRFGARPFALVIEELARGCAGVATLLGAHHLGLLPVLLSGDLRQYARVLRPIAGSARGLDPGLAAFAITEPGAGSDAEDTEGSRTARLSCFAVHVSGGYRLNGRKCFISNGSVARWITVFAAVERAEGVASWTCLVVRPPVSGFSVGRIEHKMGQRASPAAELVFDDVFVPEADVVAGEKRGWKLNRMTLDVSRAGVGAMGLGVARGALERAIELAGRRDLGPRPLLAYPEVRFELADLITKVETVRSLVWRACSTFPPDAALSATAKCVAADVAVEVVTRAMALFGDAGLTAELGLEKRLRDARLLQIFEGTNQVNRVLVAETRLPPAR
jgi:alkylation response protein AidB-like acyl-CoA dehydrogenase